jgi:hypothetical protein
MLPPEAVTEEYAGRSTQTESGGLRPHLARKWLASSSVNARLSAPFSIYRAAGARSSTRKAICGAAGAKFRTHFPVSGNADANFRTAEATFVAAAANSRALFDASGNVNGRPRPRSRIYVAADCQNHTPAPANGSPEPLHRTRPSYVPTAIRGGIDALATAWLQRVRPLRAAIFTARCIFPKQFRACKRL